MSVTDMNKVDAMGLSLDGKHICMFITDHLDWEDEYGHLKTLQDKINAYVAYLESGDWQSRYPKDLEGAIIQIDFLYDITPNCERFLQVVQDQLGQYCIEIKAVIADDSVRNAVESNAKEESTSEF